MESAMTRRNSGAEQAIRPGDVVESRCGRDAGRRMLVLAVWDESPAPDSKGCLVLELADGRVRRVEKPKRKKARHVRLLAEPRSDGPENSETILQCLRKAAEKLRDGGTVTNSEVRRALNAYAEAYGFDARRDADVKG